MDVVVWIDSNDPAAEMELAILDLGRMRIKTIAVPMPVAKRRVNA
jgi:hypothetical protein